MPKSFQPLLEAILLIKGDEGVSTSELVQMFHVPSSQLKTTIKSLKSKYSQDPQSGIQLQEFAKHRLRLVVKPQYGQQLFKLDRTLKPTNLSRPAYEVLAILGHKGEATRRQIEQIRGVNSDQVMNNLIAKKLIKLSRRSNLPGRPWFYAVTIEFYKVFNLNSIPELVTPVTEEKVPSHNLYEE